MKRYVIYWRDPWHSDWSYYCVCSGASAVMENMIWLRSGSELTQVKFEPVPADYTIDLRGTL